MLSRGELKGQILRLLNKSAKNPGFYTEDRVNDVIQECLDYVAVEMFTEGQGWQNKIGFIATVAGQITLPVPTNMAMIREVRLRRGDDYLPLYPEEEMGRAVAAPQTGGSASSAGTYRIVDNRFLFPTALSEGHAQGLMVEYFGFPAYLADDAQFLPSHFNNAMTHFIKYRAASLLLGNHGDPDAAWKSAEVDWYGKMRFVIAKRNMQAKYIREFEG